MLKYHPIQFLLRSRIRPMWISVCYWIIFISWEINWRPTITSQWYEGLHCLDMDTHKHFYLSEDTKYLKSIYSFETTNYMPQTTPSSDWHWSVIHPSLGKKYLFGIQLVCFFFFFFNCSLAYWDALVKQGWKKKQWNRQHTRFNTLMGESHWKGLNLLLLVCITHRCFPISG